MKIAIDLLRVYGKTGNAVYTEELIKALLYRFPKHDYKIILYLNKKKQAKNLFGDLPNKSTFLNLLPHKNLLGSNMRPLLTNFVRHIERLVAKNVDIYHCTNPLEFPFGIKNGAVTLHDLIALHPESWTSPGCKAFYRENIRRVLNEAGIVFAVSEFTRQEAVSRFPEIANKIVTTPLAASSVFRKIDDAENILKKYNINIRSPYLLYVGEIQPRKNIEALFSAFDSLPNRLMNNTQIIIVGSARRKENMVRFQEALRKMRNRNKVIHLQNIPVEDLVKLYNKAYAFVYLSFYEGFGLPVLEAMSCGCPVLTSNTTSLKEVSAEAALTANPEDPEDILFKLQSILENPSLHKSLSEKGLQRAKDFSWQRTAETTVRGYKMFLKL